VGVSASPYQDSAGESDGVVVLSVDCGERCSQTASVARDAEVCVRVCVSLYEPRRTDDGINDAHHDLVLRPHGR
jgi:hypothetical protein